MQKHVKPAQVGASIPDPGRGGPLPQEGANVEYNAYWISIASRGDIIVSDATNVGNGDGSVASPAVRASDELGAHRSGTPIELSVSELETFLLSPGRPVRTAIDSGGGGGGGSTPVGLSPIVAALLFG